MVMTDILIPSLNGIKGQATGNAGTAGPSPAAGGPSGGDPFSAVLAKSFLSGIGLIDKGRSSVPSASAQPKDSQDGLMKETEKAESHSSENQRTILADANSAALVGLVNPAAGTPGAGPQQSHSATVNEEPTLMKKGTESAIAQNGFLPITREAMSHRLYRALTEKGEGHHPDLLLTQLGRRSPEVETPQGVRPQETGKKKVFTRIPTTPIGHIPGQEAVLAKGPSVGMEGGDALKRSGGSPGETAVSPVNPEGIGQKELSRAESKNGSLSPIVAGEGKTGAGLLRQGGKGVMPSESQGEGKGVEGFISHQSVGSSGAGSGTGTGTGTGTESGHPGHEAAFGHPGNGSRFSGGDGIQGMPPQGTAIQASGRGAVIDERFQALHGMSSPSPRMQMDVQLSDTTRVQMDVAVQHRQVYAGLVTDHSAFRTLAVQNQPQLQDQLSQAGLDLRDFHAQDESRQGSQDQVFQGHDHEFAETASAGESVNDPLQRARKREMIYEEGVHIVA